MNRKERNRYYASREWAKLREAVRTRSGNKCERCKKNKMDAVHHLTYENVGHEPLEDLQAICDPCHAFLSGKLDSDPCESDADRLFKKIHEAFQDYRACKAKAIGGTIEDFGDWCGSQTYLAECITECEELDLDKVARMADEKGLTPLMWFCVGASCVREVLDYADSGSAET